MHINPGVVDGAKIVLSYATGLASLGIAGRMAWDQIRAYGEPFSLAIRSVMTTALVFVFFEVLPHFPVGVSEVHLILGSTLLLMFGTGAAAIGLALGLLIQGVFFAPFDLPQYGMNITTLIVPLIGIQLLAKKIISPKTPYVELRYSQALALSTAYQAGIVGWVAFWAFYGHGFSAANVTSVLTFGSAYMTVILIEPLVDLAVLAAAKSLRGITGTSAFNARLHAAA